jgi:hypothetical protein
MRRKCVFNNANEFDPSSYGPRYPHPLPRPAQHTHTYTHVHAHAHTHTHTHTHVVPEPLLPSFPIVTAILPLSCPHPAPIVLPIAFNGCLVANLDSSPPTGPRRHCHLHPFTRRRHHCNRITSLNMSRKPKLVKERGGGEGRRRGEERYKNHL